MNTTSCVAVAGSIGRANGTATGYAVCNSSGHDIAATVIFAEYLAQKAPNGRDRTEHSVPVRDTMFLENGPNVGLGQDVGERKSLIARKATAYRIQV